MNKKNYYKSIICKFASESPNPIPSAKGYRNRVRKITECGNNKTLLTISYVDKKGNRTKRIVEPYKLTESDFWGYDTVKNEIRRFKTQNIKGVKKSIKGFEPRWDIEMDN